MILSTTSLAARSISAATSAPLRTTSSGLRDSLMALATPAQGRMPCSRQGLPLAAGRLQPPDADNYVQLI